MDQSIKADLHCHFTTRSRVLDVSRVVDTVRTRLGENGICALINYEDCRFEAFAKKAGSRGNLLGNAVYFPQEKVLIVRGQEIPAASGDLLVLALDEGIHLPARQPLYDTARDAFDLGGCVILTSPFYRSNVGNEVSKDASHYIPWIHGVETFNANVPDALNTEAQNLLFERLIPKIPQYSMQQIEPLACSDSHTFRGACQTYTQFTVPTIPQYTNSSEVREAITNLVQYSPRTFHKQRCWSDKAEHIAILAPMILASKFGIQLSRGDKEALHPQQ